MQAVTNTIHVNLLGSPTVTFQGEPIRFRSRKVLALFIYLLVTDELQSRDKLIALFWPESDQSRGRLSLRTTLSRLRQALKAAGDILQIDGDLVGINEEIPLTLDINSVETNLLIGETSSKQLPQAFFLDSFSLGDAPGFDDWVSIQRAYWQQKVEALYERICHHQLSGGQRDLAIQTATQWLQIAPLSEAAYRALLEGYVLMGARTAALKTYKACREMLAAEFDVPPSEETEQIMASLREGRSAEKRFEFTEETTARLSKLPFTGRTVEHQRLVATFRQISVSGAHVAAIIGEAGIGKTRLVEDFLIWLSLQSTSIDVLACRAFEMGGRLPYQPLIQALRDRIELENAPDDLLPDVWLSELARVLPELLDRYPDLELPIVGDAELARSRLFEAIVMFGKALAERGPVILFLDDLQWADEGTLELLHYAIQRWREIKAPILFLTTVRQEGIAERPAIGEWFKGLEIDGYFTRIALTLLKSIEIVTLLRVMTQQHPISESGEDLFDEFGRWLHVETGGSPLFLDAILRFMLEQGILQKADWDQEGQLNRGELDVDRALNYIRQDDRLPLPPTMREVILNRLQKLDEAANRLLIASSVLGRNATFERLCQIAGSDQLKSLAALDRLLQQRLLIEASGKRPYRFAHDHIRQIVYDQLGEAHKRVYHRRAFEGLESEGMPASELAFHARVAHLDKGTFDYSIVAGDEAADTFGFEEAVVHFNSAWRMIIDDGYTPSSDQLIHLCQELGRSLEMDNRIEEAFSFFEQVERLALELKNQQVKLVALIGQATYLATPTAIQDLQKAETLANEALNLSRSLSQHASEAKALWLLQLRYAYTRVQYDLSVTYGEASLAIARKHDLRQQMSYTLNDLVSPYREVGRVEDAIVAETEARGLFKELNNLPMLADSYNLSAYWALMEVSDFEGALSFATQGLELSRLIGNLYNQYSGQLATAMIYLETGLFGESIFHFKQSIETLTKMKAGQIYEGLGHLCLLYGELGIREEVQSICRRTLDQIAEIPEWSLVRAISHCAQGAASIDDLGLAKKLLAQIEHVDLNAISYHASLPAIIAKSKLFLLQNECDGLLALIKQYLPKITQPNMHVWGLPEVCYLQGIAYLEKNDAEQALSILEKGAAISRESGERRIFWRTLLALADVENERGNSERSKALRREARATLEIIVENIPEGELRASFVARPEVSSILI